MLSRDHNYGTPDRQLGIHVRGSALWKRTAFGANYFYKRHNIKAQVTYRIGTNVDGKDGSDEDELFVQARYFF